MKIVRTYILLLYSLLLQSSQIKKEIYMRKKLTIVAKIEANPDKIEFVKAELLKLIEPTLKESGCVQYDLHQDDVNSAVFMFYETWESRELWQMHMSNKHLAEYMRATEGSVLAFTLNEMVKL